MSFLLSCIRGQSNTDLHANKYHVDASTAVATPKCAERIQVHNREENSEEVDPEALLCLDLVGRVVAEEGHVGRVPCSMVGPDLSKKITPSLSADSPNLVSNFEACYTDAVMSSRTSDGSAPLSGYTADIDGTTQPFRSTAAQILRCAHDTGDNNSCVGHRLAGNGQRDSGTARLHKVRGTGADSQRCGACGAVSASLEPFERLIYVLEGARHAPRHSARTFTREHVLHV